MSSLGILLPGGKKNRIIQTDNSLEKARSVNELEALGDEMIGEGIKNQWSSIRNGYHQKAKGGILSPTIDRRDSIGRRAEEEKTRIEKERPDLQVFIIPKWANVTSGYRTDGVRLFVDDAGLIIRVA